MSNMSNAISVLFSTLSILEKYRDHTPPTPRKGCFYKTYNGSVVYIVDTSDPLEETRAVVLKGGVEGGHSDDEYFLDEDGYPDDQSVGPHLVMTLAEELDIRLP